MSIIQITEVHSRDAFYEEEGSPHYIIGTICEITADTKFHPCHADPTFIGLGDPLVLKWAHIPTEKDFGKTCFYGVKYKVLFK